MALYKSIPEFRDSDIERFWAKVDKSEDINECWNWTAFVHSPLKPYGRFSINHKYISSHRASYFLYNKKDPKELHVLHKCDNPRCVNPHHLFEGTNKDNAQDKVKKGRCSKYPVWNKGLKGVQVGEDIGISKLKENQVLEIRQSYIFGSREFGGYGLAKKYNVSQHAIMDILHKKTWMHI